MKLYLSFDEIGEKFYTKEGLSEAKSLKHKFIQKCWGPCNKARVCLRTKEFNRFRKKVREILGISGEFREIPLPCVIFPHKFPNVFVTEEEDLDGFKHVIVYSISFESSSLRDVVTVKDIVLVLPRWWHE